MPVAPLPVTVAVKVTDWPNADRVDRGADRGGGGRLVDCLGQRRRCAGRKIAVAAIDRGDGVAAEGECGRGERRRAGGQRAGAQRGRAVLEGHGIPGAGVPRSLLTVAVKVTDWPKLLGFRGSRPRWSWRPG